MLSFKEIKELIDLVTERGLSGLEIERAGFRIRIEGGRPAVSNGVAEGFATTPPSAAMPGTGAPAEPEARGRPRPHLADRRHLLPRAVAGRATLRRGRLARSQKGQVALHHRGDEADERDRVRRRRARSSRSTPQNGQPVEFGEPLFAIRLDGVASPTARRPRCSRRS